MSEYLQAAMTLLSLVNPVICATMFVDLEGGDLTVSGRKDATTAAAAILVVLTVAALAGVRLLGLFGISLTAFQVAGGIVLLWMGFSMLRGSDRHETVQRPAGGGAGRLTPLILFAASPGTITGVITISASHTGTDLPVTALVGVAVAVGVTWATLMLASRAGAGRRSGGLVHDIGTRFMGLIVLAMGVQFALSGYKAFMGTG
ncbi:MAG: MarC family protein [Acidobacteriota bacterium]|jgi:multiple antibiotic resistance protein